MACFEVRELFIVVIDINICAFKASFLLSQPQLNSNLNITDIVPVHAILDEITTWCSLSNCPNFNQKFNFKLLCPLKHKNPTYGSKVTAISNKIRC